MKLEELKKIAETSECRFVTLQTPDFVELVGSYEKAVEALKDVKKNLSNCMLDSYPMNVRELDGSISQVRLRTIEGKVVDAIKQTLKELGEL